MPRRLALLCGAGRFPPTLFMGQIVFVKLFAPVSLQAPAASWPRRGSDLRVAPERGQERPQRNRSPGGLQESVWGFLKKQNHGPISFYFILKSNEQQSGGVFFPLGS